MSSIILQSRLKRFAFWLVGIVVLIGLIGFLVVPPIAKHQIAKLLSRELHRETSIESISFNPFTLEARVRGFLMKDRMGAKPAMAFDELYVDLASSSIARLAPVITALKLTKPYINLIRTEDGRYNLSDIIDEFLARPKSESPPRFSLNNIELVDGKIEVEDRPERMQHSVSDIHIAVPFISSLPFETKIYVEPRFEAKINGDAIRLTGRTLPFEDTLETTLDLTARDIDLRRYLDYSPVALEFKLASGRLSTDLELKFTRFKDKPPLLGLSGTVGLRDIALTQKTGEPLVKLNALDLKIASFDLTANRLILDRIGIEQPELVVKRNAAGEINLSQLAPKIKASESTPRPAKEAQQPFALEAKEISLSNGRVQFADDTTAKPFRIKLDAITATIRDFALAPERPAQVEASLRADNGLALKHSGTLTLAPLASAGQIEIAKLRPKDYAPYFERSVLFDIDDGSLDARAAYDFKQGQGDPQVTLSNIQLALQSLRLRSRSDKAEIVRIGQLAASGGRLDLAKRTVSIGELTSRDGKLLVKRARDGSINLAKLTPPADVRASPPAANAASPWNFDLKRVALDAYALRFEDDSQGTRATTQLDPLALTIENLSSAAGSRANASIRTGVNKSGSFSASGPVSFDPLSAKLKYQAKAIDLVPYQPYFTQFVTATVGSGNISSAGSLALEMGANNILKTTFSGDLTVGDFASVDKATGEDFLKWKSLYLGGIAVNTEPMAITVAEIALADFYSRLVLSAEGRLNVQDVLVKKDPPASGQVPTDIKTSQPAEAAQATLSPDIKLGKITLQGGNINYSDFFIKPNYRANLTGIGGAVSALTPDTPGDIELRGKVDNSAPVEITGKVNPLANPFFLDIKASARDIELSPLTPYSAKYVGYGIQRGKLSLKVAYKIENNKLEAQNNVYLDQLVFGERVESPDALKAPVLLAVALLKDRNGVIDVNLPVSGSLDDPQFSIGGIIVRVIVNLIVRAVSSPFALLSSAFGGGEELGYVEYEPGRSVLSAASAGRLKTLAKALTDRPALKLDVTGRADPSIDRDGLLKAKLDQALRVEKTKELAKKGTPAAPAGEVSIEPAEYPRYLELAYKAASFPKPRNAIGLARDLPTPEMEKLMLANTQVSDEELRTLAAERARTAKDYLLDNGSVSADRIFIVAPKLSSAETKDKGAPTRADFALR